MQKLGELSFRQLDKTFLFISISDVSFLNDYFENAENANGMLSYVYIDHEKGICFEILCCAFFDAEKQGLKLYAPNDNVSVNMDYEQLVELDVLALSKNILPLDKLQTKIVKVDAISIVSDAIAKTRAVTAIDGCRITGKPDEVVVHLVKGNEYFETVSVRLEEVGKMNLVGTLLENPQKDFGVKYGDIINFFIVKNEQGIMCMVTF